MDLTSEMSPIKI
jgi:hypothetical protein